MDEEGRAGISFSDAVLIHVPSVGSLKPGSMVMHVCKDMRLDMLSDDLGGFARS